MKKAWFQLFICNLTSLVSPASQITETAANEVEKFDATLAGLVRTKIKADSAIHDYLEKKCER